MTDQPTIVDDDLTLAEAAPLANMSPSSLQRRCRRGLIPGARKKGKTWLIPVAAIPHIKIGPMGRPPLAEPGE